MSLRLQPRRVLPDLGPMRVTQPRSLRRASSFLAPVLIAKVPSFVGFQIGVRTNG